MFPLLLILSTLRAEPDIVIITLEAPEFQRILEDNEPPLLDPEPKESYFHPLDFSLEDTYPF